MATFDFNFFSKSLRKQTKGTVVIPFDAPEQEYLERPEEYRSVYLLHGFSANHTEWMSNSTLHEFSRMFDCAFIMPDGDKSFYLDNKTSGENYEEYICYELPEFVNGLFPLSKKQKDITIGGLSMGGFGALHSGLTRPDYFGNIFALSSALIVDQIAEMEVGSKDMICSYDFYNYIFGDLAKLKGSKNDPKFLAKEMMDKGGSIPNIYLACGREDFLIEHNRDFKRYLDEIHLPHTYVEDEGAHSWHFWHKYLFESLKWIKGLER